MKKQMEGGKQQMEWGMDMSLVLVPSSDRGPEDTMMMNTPSCWTVCGAYLLVRTIKGPTRNRTDLFEVLRNTTRALALKEFFEKTVKYVGPIFCRVASGQNGCTHDEKSIGMVSQKIL